MTDVACLDHVGVVGRELQPLLAAYRRLGFAPTEPKTLFGRDRATGAPVSLGQSSAHLVFGSGYVELSAVHSTSPDHHLASYLDRHAGLHILAFGVNDIAAAQARCLAAGLPATPVAAASRPIEYGERHGEARFEWFMVEAAAAPEGLLCGVRHVTPELVFQPEVQRHPNRVEALAGLYVVTAEAPAALQRLAAVTGASAGDGDTLALVGGWIRVLSPAAFAARFPGAGIPAAPCLAGFALRTADLGKARACCAVAGVAVREQQGGFWVPAREAGGCVVEFGG